MGNTGKQLVAMFSPYQNLVCWQSLTEGKLNIGLAWQRLFI
jgi:hypothetical protein